MLIFHHPASNLGNQACSSSLPLRSTSTFEAAVNLCVCVCVCITASKTRLNEVYHILLLKCDRSLLIFVVACLVAITRTSVFFVGLLMLLACHRLQLSCNTCFTLSSFFFVFFFHSCQGCPAVCHWTRARVFPRAGRAMNNTDASRDCRLTNILLASLWGQAAFKYSLQIKPLAGFAGESKRVLCVKIGVSGPPEECPRLLSCIWTLSCFCVRLWLGT